MISANITSWRKDLCPWIAQHKASILLLQETHLSPEQPDLIDAQLGFHGYGVFSIPGHPTGKGGTSGGLAICFRKHLNLRCVHHFVKAGAGYQVAALRLKDVDCYFVNVYLKAGEGFQGSLNAQILASLIPFLRSVRGLYFLAGDFNEDFDVIAATSLEQEAKGRWISSGESTCAGGGNIDYGLLAPVLAAGASLSVDWVTPFAPHAALHWSLQLQHFDVKLPQLAPFRPAQVQPRPFELRLAIDEQGEQAAQAHTERAVHLLGVDVANPGLSALFASLSRDVELSVYSASQGRGSQVRCQRKPLLVQRAPLAGWGGAQASFWNRMVVWLEACSRSFHVSPFAQRAAQKLKAMWHGNASEAEAFCSELRATIDNGHAGSLPGLLETAKGQHKLHFKKWQQEKNASYAKWLRQASLKGMRPLFKSVKSEEVITIRPFLDAPVQERIYLRWRQWFDLWSRPDGVDPALLASLKAAAIEQAGRLPPISLDRAVSFFKKVPCKAPGLDGWTCEVLLHLSAEAVQAILDFFHHCERQAAWPDQLVFALIALLPKSEKRERPIALLHILYRAWVKLRWQLVADWQAAYARQAQWDKAVPGGQVLDVALARLMLGETVRRSKHHLITLFLDMETFYDRCLFNDVINSGLSLQYPPLILHQALLTYMGPRFVQSEGSLCPPIWPGRGVLAGCPAAPSVSKLVIHPVAAKLASKKTACNLDIWIDDLSLDSINKSPLHVASDCLKLFRGLRQDLESKGAQVSISKTCFVASSKEAAKALERLRGSTDPKVKPLNRDLGITSAGGRRRVLGLAEHRRKKAAGRSRKLNKLAVPGRAHRIRIVRASLCSAGLWGHQAQGVSPKRRKFYRTLVAKHLGRHKLGCLDLTFLVHRRRCEDPHLTLLRQHVRSVARVFRRWQSVDPDKFRSTWASIWLWLVAAQHPWKRVNGPLAALMAYLGELGVQAPQAHHWHKGDSHLTIDWSSLDATRRVWQWLLPLWEEARLQRVAKLEGCHALDLGVDFAVQDRLQKRKFFNKNMAVNLQALWQGALLSRSKPGWCTACNCPLDLQHVLWDCPFISDKFPLPPHLREARAKFPWPSLWLRGLVPKDVTRLGELWNSSGCGIPEWRRLINADVDELCGSRAARVYADASKPDLEAIDRLCEDVCLHLARKIGYILQRKKDKSFPWLLERSSLESQRGVSSQVIPGDKFVKPMSGPKVCKPNKMQRLKDMLANPDPALGHVWRDCESKAVNNFAIQCTVCKLYVEQCNAQDVFNRKASNPCQGIVGTVPPIWQVHETHDMLNKGSFFTCTKCLAIVKVASTSASSLLQAPCKGLGRKIKSGTQLKSMANVESAKNHSIETAMQGLERRSQEIANDTAATTHVIHQVPKAPAKPKGKPKAKSKDSFRQTRLSFN